MTKTWFCLSVFFGAVFMLASLGCDGKTREEKEAERKERWAKVTAEETEVLSRFGSRFNAEVVNNEELRDKVLDGAYSMVVEKTLIREGGNPIVFWSTVKDVSKSARGYLVHFNDWDFSIHYSLKCQEDHINLILENTSEVNHPYAQFAVVAVVAVIDSVKKIDLMSSADTNTLKEDTPSIELASGRTFWAIGRCLALKPKFPRIVTDTVVHDKKQLIDNKPMEDWVKEILDYKPSSNEPSPSVAFKRNGINWIMERNDEGKPELWTVYNDTKYIYRLGGIGSGAEWYEERVMTAIEPLSP